MGEPVALDRIAKGGNDMILAKHVCKRPRAVFSGKNLVAHAGQSSGERKIYQ